MLNYVFRRMLTMCLTLLVVSFLVFIIINLPPGDYLSNQMRELQATGESAGIAKLEFLRAQYSLDEPLLVQYLIWLGVWPGANGFSGLLQGDFGWSFEFDRPVAEIVGSAMWLTIVVNLFSILFIYIVALPLGVLAAVRANSWVDYICALVGYFGLATPNFLLALALLYYGQKYIGLPIGGLMDPELEGQPLSLEMVLSVLEHLIIPTIVIGTAGAAAMIQRLRANLLDELSKPYVTTATAKGVPPTKRTLKYPLKVALNPFIADIGNLLPSLVSGSVLVSVVLSLPTVGPILLSALRSQDMFLSGFILLFASVLTLVGMLLSDLLLAWIDPRIRFEGRGSK